MKLRRIAIPLTLSAFMLLALWLALTGTPALAEKAPLTHANAPILKPIRPPVVSTPEVFLAPPQAMRPIPSMLDSGYPGYTAPVPAANLRLETRAHGNAAPDGNQAFEVRYYNDSALAATDVILTGTFTGGTYLSHSNSFPKSGSAPVVFQIGTIPPGSQGEFEIYVAVTTTAGNPVTFVADITDQDNGSAHAETSVMVQASNTHLNVNKNAWTGDPAPGFDTVFNTNICNNGGTGSATLVFTDGLPDYYTLRSWWTQNPGWTEVLSAPHQLVLQRPTLPGGWCTAVYLQATLAATLTPGTPLSNTAQIASANNQETNNTSIWNGNAGSPYLNLYVDKNWGHGRLVPGGQLNYWIHYQNQGNIPLTDTLRLTDTLPVSTTFRGAGLQTPQGWQLFTPTLQSGDLVVWEIPGMLNGYSNNFLVTLDVAAEALPGAILTNTVEFPLHPAENNGDDNRDVAVEQLFDAGPNLRITAEHDNNQWENNRQLSYRLYVQNIGSEPIYNAVITETYPAGTSLQPGSVGWNGWFQGVTWSEIPAERRLIFNLAEIQPATSFEIRFNADIAGDPWTPGLWYTNTTVIAPLTDTHPIDNYAEDIAFSGGEVERVEIWFNGESSNAWGQALPGVVTLTSPYTTVTVLADGSCGGCWPSNSANPELGPLQPGDRITVTAGSGTMPVYVQIPAPFTTYGDSAGGQVWGEIGGWYNQQVEINGYWPGGDRSTQSDASGHYTATFSNFPRGGSGQTRIRTYQDYATVVLQRDFASPDLISRVNYGDNWIEGNYEAGYTLWLTVTNAGGTAKGTASGMTGPIQNWNGRSGFSTNSNIHWNGNPPDITPGDWVYGRLSNGYTTTVHVGTINGTLTLAESTISGTIMAPWFSEQLNAECGIWENNGPYQQFAVEPNGGNYSCNFSEQWTLTPGQTVGVTYYEPDGDAVINVFREPTPHVMVQKYGNGTPGEGSNFSFQINYQNNTDGAAPDLVITETLSAGLLYITDTTGLTHTGSGTTGDPLIWNFGTLPAQGNGQFTVFAQVTAAAGEWITNTARIATSNPYDEFRPWEYNNGWGKTSEWSSQVTENNTHLNLSKRARTNDPAPGFDTIFELNACNNGSTASSAVTITDTLPPSLTVKNWWGQMAGWTQVTLTPDTLVVSYPSLAAHSCTQIYLRATVDPEAGPGLNISNTAVITAANDREAEDNLARWNGQVNNPHTNLSINQNFSQGSLVPDGWIQYNLNYNNNGNTPITTTLRITDTLPAGTTFRIAARYDQNGTHPITPVLITDQVVVWEIAELENGFNHGFDIILDIAPETLPGTLLSNTLTISPQPNEDNVDDNTNVWTEQIYPQGPNLRVRKQGSWDDGGTNTRRATYNLKVENIGNARIDHLTFTDTYALAMDLDNNMNFDWGRVESWQNQPDAHLFTATLQYLNPGESTNVNYSAMVPGNEPLPFGMRYTNTVQLMPIPNNVTATDDSAAVVLTTGPDLFVEKALTAGILRPGQLITFTLRFGNDRNGNEWWWNLQNNAVLTDMLPLGLEFVAAQQHWCGPGGEWCDQTPQRPDATHLVWTLWPIGSSEWNEIRVTLRITDTATGRDTLINRAEIASEQPAMAIEPDTANNTASAAVSIDLPYFTVGKVYASSRVVGTRVVYTLTVSNTGQATGTEIVLADIWPAGLTYNKDPKSTAANSITWSVGTLAPGTQAIRTFTATIAAAPGSTISNENYRVIASAEGVMSESGPVVTFTVIAPTIVAGFTYTPAAVLINDTVRFTDTSSTDGSAINAWLWTFGDGMTGSLQHPTHAYSTAGNYTVTLLITDTLGYTATQVMPAAVLVTPDCTGVTGVTFVYGPIQPLIHTAVAFTATLLPTSATLPITFTWDFGDGLTATGTTTNVQHTYHISGSQNARVTVYNPCTLMGVASGAQSVEVDPIRVYLPLILRNQR